MVWYAISSENHYPFVYKWMLEMKYYFMVQHQTEVSPSFSWCLLNNLKQLGVLQR